MTTKEKSELIELLVAAGMTKEHAEMAVGGFNTNTKTALEMPSSGLGNYGKPSVAMDMVNQRGVLKDYNNGVMEVGFKYMAMAHWMDERPECPKAYKAAQEKFMAHLGISFVKKGPLQKDIYANEDRTVFFNFEDGGIGYYGYSAMVAYDLSKGIEMLKKIGNEESPVVYIKDMEMFCNCLSNVCREEFDSLRK